MKNLSFSEIWNNPTLRGITTLISLMGDGGGGGRGEMVDDKGMEEDSAVFAWGLSLQDSST